MIKHSDCKLGDIVYYVDYVKNNNDDQPRIRFGTVNDMFSDGLYLDLYVAKDMRTVMCEYDGWKPVLITDFKPDNRWHKLPKGWTYNTQLYKYGTADGAEDIMKCIYDSNYDNPASLKDLIIKGYLVKKDTQPHLIVDDDVTKDGYKIVRCISESGYYNPDHELVSWNKAYADYSGAESELNAYTTELKRVASLTDEEWSKEQIEHTLARYKSFGQIDNETISKIRDYLYKQKNIEDIETRITHEGFQYKYFKNKKWITIGGNVA